MHTRNTRVCGATGADRISDLHESLISNILSRLPTMDAVRTCVLSKSWRYSWTSLQSVHLVERRHGDIPNFPNRVARILSLRLINNVTSITVQCSGAYLEHVSSWIYAVLGRANNQLLEELVLSFNHRERHLNIYLPQELFDYASLRKLHLGSGFVTRAPLRGVINFPNLTSLYLRGVRIKNVWDCDTDSLVLKLPALKVLKLNRCSWGLFQCVEIHAPGLSSFDYSRDYGSGDRRDYSIKIIAERLTLYNMSLYCLQENIVLGASTVDCTRLGFNFPYVEDIPGFRELVKKISHVKHLILSGQTAAVIVQERLAPVYGTVEGLEISGNIGIGSTMELLDAMPKLKYLTLDANTEMPDRYEQLASRLISHLEEVGFTYKNVWDHRFCLESFILKTATKLKKVSLSIDTNTTSLNEIVNKISTLIIPYSTPTITKKGSCFFYVFRRQIDVDMTND